MALPFFTEKKSITEPRFVKDFVKESKKVSALEKLAEQLKEGDKKESILTAIQLERMGKEGDNNVYFEIKNSFIPSLCLYDVRIDYKGYTAQYDFIIVTNKYIAVIETKSMVDNIKITKAGEFIRVIRDDYGEVIREEGIYSPIAQTERNCKILQDLLVANKKIINMPVIPIVVIADAKTVIDRDDAPAEVNSKLFRLDKIVNILKENMDEKSNKIYMREKYMIAITDFIIDQNIQVQFDDCISEFNIIDSDYLEIMKERELLSKKLKEYSLNKAKEEQIKPYHICNNTEMAEIIEKWPKTVEELACISGFDDIKIAKYGDDIINIVNEIM